MLFLMLCFQTFLAAMVANIRELIVWNRHLALFNNVYEFSMIIVPSIIVAPRYFSGEVHSTTVIYPNVHFIETNKHFYLVSIRLCASRQSIRTRERKILS